MRRFTLQPERLAGGRVSFDAGESRHLSRVLRLRPGDTVLATDGAGRDFTVRLESVGEAATGTVLAEAAGFPASPLAITLIQGVPKGDKMETIVRSASVVVGPEGGLARAEVDAARAHGLIVTSLGPRILRTETAGPAIVAVLQSRFGDLG